jgi:hypothetical protein
VAGNFSAWRVGVIFTATNQTGAAFNQIAMGAAFARNHTMALNMAILNMFSQAKSGAFAASRALMDFGAAAIKAAGDYQLGTTQLSLATPGINMDAVQSNIWKQYSDLAQTPYELQQEYLKASQAGFTAKMLQDDRFMFKVMQFADVQKITHGAPVEETVTQLAQLAHLFGAYDPGSMSTLVEQAYRLQMMGNPEDFSRLVQQGKYFVPLAAQTMNMPTKDIMSLYLGLAQTGMLRGRGGTGVQNILLDSIDAIRATSHMQSAQAKALHALGIIDASGSPRFWTGGHRNKQGVLVGGHLDMNAELDWLHSLRNAGVMSTKDFTRDVAAAFQRTGSQVILSFLGDQAFQQRHALEQKMAAGQGLDAAQKQSLATLPGALLHLQAVLFDPHSAFQTALGLPAVKSAAYLINSIAYAVAGLANALHAHSGLALAALIGMATVSLASFGVGIMFFVGQLRMASMMLQQATGMNMWGMAGRASTYLPNPFAGAAGLGRWSSYGGVAGLGSGPMAFLRGSVLIMGLIAAIYDLVSVFKLWQSHEALKRNEAWQRQQHLLNDHWNKTHQAIVLHNGVDGIYATMGGVRMTPAMKAMYDRHKEVIDAQAKNTKSLEKIAVGLEEHPTELIIDGRVIAETVNRYNARNARFRHGQGR